MAAPEAARIASGEQRRTRLPRIPAVATRRRGMGRTAFVAVAVAGSARLAVAPPMFCGLGGLTGGLGEGAARLSQRPRVQMLAVASRSDAMRILGIQPGGDDPSAAQVKKAFRRSVLRAHPDAGGSSEQLRSVQEAYEYMTSKGSAVKDIGATGVPNNVRNWAKSVMEDETIPSGGFDGYGFRETVPPSRGRGRPPGAASGTTAEEIKSFPRLGVVFGWAWAVIVAFGLYFSFTVYNNYREADQVNREALRTGVAPAGYEFQRFGVKGGEFQTGAQIALRAQWPLMTMGTPIPGSQAERPGLELGASLSAALDEPGVPADAAKFGSEAWKEEANAVKAAAPAANAVEPAAQAAAVEPAKTALAADWYEKGGFSASESRFKTLVAVVKTEHMIDVCNALIKKDDGSEREDLQVDTFRYPYAVYSGGLRVVHLYRLSTSQEIFLLEAVGEPDTVTRLLPDTNYITEFLAAKRGDGLVMLDCSDSDWQITAKDMGVPAADTGTLKASALEAVRKGVARVPDGAALPLDQMEEVTLSWPMPALNLDNMRQVGRGVRY